MAVSRLFDSNLLIYHYTTDVMYMTITNVADPELCK